MANGDVAIINVTVDKGHESVRILRRRIARRNVVRANAATGKRCRRRLTLLVTECEIKLASGAGRQFTVDVNSRIFGFGIANDARITGFRAIGAPTVEVFCGDTNHAFLAHLQTAVGRSQVVLAVTSRILSVTKHGFAAQPFLEPNVDHAGNRVRAVLCGGAIAQHLYAFNRQQRDRIHISTRIATIARTE